MRLSDQTIQEIRTAADIVEVVESFVPLKKKGQNWWALSPFTNEKTPSFSVSPAKGIFKCFSTGKGGDSITFIMEMEGLGYIDALKYLAKKYNIDIAEEEYTPEQQEAYNHKESLHIALNFAKEYYQDQLLHTTLGKSIGLSYFKERGFSTETIDSFELGYSQDEWSSFEKEALKNGHQPEILEQAGLVVARDDGKRYDRFRGRVMFPIQNLSGRVIGFGARTLKKDKQAKYLNSPESDVYHKSDVLYGLYQAKKDVRNKDNCYLVEGYTDVISLYQNGIQNVVASSGTSLTENQITLIKRFTHNVTVLFDGDKAGIKASLRGVDMLLAQGLNVRVVSFPDGQDPDSYVREIGGAAFQTFLHESAQDFILFKTNLQLSDAAGDPIKKAEVVRDIVQSIAKIPDPIKRTVFCEECSNLLNIDVDLLLEEVKKAIITETNRKNQQAAYQKRREAKSSPTPPPPTFDEGEPFFFEEEYVPQEGEFVDAEQQADLPVVPKQAEVVITESLSYQEQESIRILVQHGQEEIGDGKRLAEYWLSETDGIDFQSPLYKEMLALYREQLDQGNYPDANFFLKDSPSHIKEAVTKITEQKGAVSSNWMDKHQIFIPGLDQNLSDIVYKNIIRLKHRTIKKLWTQVAKKIQEAEAEKDEVTLMDNLRIYQELKNQGIELAKILGMNYS